MNLQMQNIRSRDQFMRNNEPNIRRNSELSHELRGYDDLYRTRNLMITKESHKYQEKSVGIVTKNFQFIVLASRLIGCHPHTIFFRNEVKTTKLAKLWSLVWVFISMALLGIMLRHLVLCQMETSGDSVCTYLILNRMAVIVGCGMRSLMSVIRAESYEKAIRRIQEFDGATGFRTKRIWLENLVTGALIALVFILVFWFFGGNFENINALILINMFGICAFSLEIYKFSYLLFGVHRRFVKLGKIAASGKMDINSSKGFYQPLTVQNVFFSYNSLAKAVKNLNTYYEIQIVYWLAYYISSLIMQTYFITKTYPIFGIKLNQLCRLIMALYHPAMICIVSHFTCKRANELGQLLFRYKAPTLATTVSPLENLEFGFWLFHHPLRITGFQLFSVDLPLFLSMIEVSATYTAFIVQSALDTYLKT